MMRLTSKNQLLCFRYDDVEMWQKESWLTEPIRLRPRSKNPFGDMEKRECLICNENPRMRIFSGWLVDVVEPIMEIRCRCFSIKRH